MQCSRCKCRTRVIDSRPNSFGVMRRHACPSCGNRFSTQEVVKRDLDALVARADRAAETMRTVRRVLGELTEDAA